MTLVELKLLVSIAENLKVEEIYFVEGGDVGPQYSLIEGTLEESSSGTRIVFRKKYD